VATWLSNWHYDISITPSNEGLLQLPATCRDEVMCWLLRLKKALSSVSCFVLREQ